MEGRDFRKIEIVIEALRRHKEFQELLGGINPFLIYRTDTGTVLARGYTDSSRRRQKRMRSARDMDWSGIRWSSRQIALLQAPTSDSRVEGWTTPPTTTQASVDASRCESTQTAAQQIWIDSWLGSVLKTGFYMGPKVQSISTRSGKWFPLLKKIAPKKSLKGWGINNWVVLSIPQNPFLPWKLLWEEGASGRGAPFFIWGCKKAEIAFSTISSDEVLALRAWIILKVCEEF